MTDDTPRFLRRKSTGCSSYPRVNEVNRVSHDDTARLGMGPLTKGVASSLLSVYTGYNGLLRVLMIARQQQGQKVKALGVTRSKSMQRITAGIRENYFSISKVGFSFCLVDECSEAPLVACRGVNVTN